MIPTDEALMLAVRDGDVDRLSVLFERYHAKLFDFFCRMNGSRAAAEDLVQDVFFRILKYRNTFRDENRFVPWMYQIARNARLLHFKKHRPQEIAPEQQIERSHEEAVLLNQALSRLPEDKRELLVLVWYQEMKYEQIAELLGTNVGAVKVRVYRAVRELREILCKNSSEKQSCVVTKFKTTLRTT